MTVVTNMKELKKRAEANDLRAMCALAAILEMGILGEEKDEVKALLYWNRAAMMGIVPAMVASARLLLKGVDGSGKDPEALKWLEKANEKGYFCGLSMKSLRSAPPPPDPAAVAAAELANAKSTDPEKWESMDADPPAAPPAPVNGKILLVDDSVTVRSILSDIVRSVGYEPITAVSGKDGLAQLSKHADVRLVISDVNMPEMDGVTMIEHIRMSPAFAKLPIAMLTTESDKNLVTRARNAGVRGWLIKPPNEDQVKTIIEKLAPPIKPPSA